MSILIAKSNENLISAKLLIDNNHYASSVHCSYYSSVQLMLHLLLNKFGYTQEKLEEQAKREFKGSHVFAINTLFNKMKDKSERIKAVDFNREIGRLKHKRENADYHELAIDKDFSDEAYSQANLINEILTTVF